MVADKLANKQREFGPLYRLEHEAHFTPERTRQEVDTLVAALSLEPSVRILDLGCGWGRHLRELRARGFSSLVGVDVQEAFLEPIEGVELIAADVTSGNGVTGLESNSFDAVYCAFSALFAHEDAATNVFRAVADLLVQGGRFLFDTTNRERLVAETPARSWRGGGDLPWLLEETHFDLASGAQTLTQRRIFPDGHAETTTLTRYHYTLAELVRMLERAGLTFQSVYGDWSLNAYTAASPRMMLIARKD